MLEFHGLTGWNILWTDPLFHLNNNSCWTAPPKSTMGSYIDVVKDRKREGNERGIFLWGRGRGENMIDVQRLVVFVIWYDMVQSTDYIVHGTYDRYNTMRGMVWVSEYTVMYCIVYDVCMYVSPCVYLRVRSVCLCILPDTFSDIEDTRQVSIRKSMIDLRWKKNGRTREWRDDNKVQVMVKVIVYRSEPLKFQTHPISSHTGARWTLYALRHFDPFDNDISCLDVEWRAVFSMGIGRMYVMMI